MRLAVALLIAGFAVAGCGGATGTSSSAKTSVSLSLGPPSYSPVTTSPSSTSSSTTASSTAADAGCTIYEASADVRVTFSTSDLCAQAVKNWSGDGEYWADGDPMPSDSVSETCALSSGSSTVIVEDSGEAIDGTTICGNLVHNGWTQDSELPTVGPAELAQQQAESQSESESESQSYSNSWQTAAQTVVDDLSQLQSDEASASTDGAASAFASDLATEHGDVATTYTDLQHVLGEQGSADTPTICSDADTVSSDADSVQSDEDSVQSDLDSSSGDVTSINDDLGRLQQDEATLQQYGPGPNEPTGSQVTAAIKTARRDAATATANGNRALARANAMVKTAQGYANQAQAACS
jgi:hypothetical protein